MARINYNEITELPISFWDNVTKTNTCWIWKGRVDDGYGRFYLNKRLILVHRAVVRVLKNELLSDNLVVDHTCGVRNCCNPDHLRQITISENTKKKRGFIDPEECPNGHLLTGPDADVHRSIRRTRHNGPEETITCRVCNSVKRLSSNTELD